MTSEPAAVEEASDPLAQVRQRIADTYDDLPPRLQGVLASMVR